MGRSVKDMASLITTEKLSKTFSRKGSQHHVLKNIDLEIDGADFTVVMGPSGAGKSTLLYALSGMDRPSLGRIVFDGQNIEKMSEDKLARFRLDHCGFVFQQVYLLDSLSVSDNVLAVGLLGSRRRREYARPSARMCSCPRSVSRSCARAGDSDPVCSRCHSSPSLRSCC